MSNNKTVLNIIHPYVYKQNGQNYVMGPIEEFQERDRRISDFVNYAINSGVKVLRHEMFDDALGKIMREIGLSVDNSFKFLFDDRVKIFNTPRSGVPIPDEKPEKVTLEQWKFLREIFISESCLKREVVNGKNIFIGGMLECCVSNCMGVFTDNFCGGGRQLSESQAV